MRTAFRKTHRQAAFRCFYNICNSVFRICTMVYRQRVFVREMNQCKTGVSKISSIWLIDRAVCKMFHLLESLVGYVSCKTDSMSSKAKKTLIANCALLHFEWL